MSAPSARCFASPKNSVRNANGAGVLAYIGSAVPSFPFLPGSQTPARDFSAPSAPPPPTGSIRASSPRRIHASCSHVHVPRIGRRSVKAAEEASPSGGAGVGPRRGGSFPPSPNGARLTVLHMPTCAPLFGLLPLASAARASRPRIAGTPALRCRLSWGADERQIGCMVALNPRDEHRNKML